MIASVVARFFAPVPEPWLTTAVLARSTLRDAGFKYHSGAADPFCRRHAKIRHVRRIGGEIAQKLSRRLTGGDRPAIAARQRHIPSVESCVPVGHVAVVVVVVSCRGLVGTV